MCEYMNCKSIPTCDHSGILITLTMVYAFPCVFFFVLACPHVHLFAPACNTGLPACVPCVCVRVCTCVCVPGEPVVGQRISPHQGHPGGGDADDRQPLRFCLPPLLLSCTHLQRLQRPPTRGTTLNAWMHTKNELSTRTSHTATDHELNVSRVAHFKEKQSHLFFQTSPSAHDKILDSVAWGYKTPSAMLSTQFFLLETITGQSACTWCSLLLQLFDLTATFSNSRVEMHL